MYTQTCQGVRQTFALASPTPAAWFTCLCSVVILVGDFERGNRMRNRMQQPSLSELLSATTIQHLAAGTGRD